MERDMNRMGMSEWIWYKLNQLHGTEAVIVGIEKYRRHYTRTCGDKHYQKDLQICCGETIHFVTGNSFSCCGENNYDLSTHKCQNGKIVERA
uniref:Galaxin-like repeats domain-containing protein n=1 Tax=Octopus bimaculoides TaxID=37653 RepID=A0A0L8G9T2_OCTBM